MGPRCRSVHFCGRYAWDLEVNSMHPSFELDSSDILSGRGKDPISANLTIQNWVFRLGHTIVVVLIQPFMLISKNSFLKIAPCLFFNVYDRCPLARQSKLLGTKIPLAPFFVILRENLVPWRFFENFWANVLRDLTLLLTFF